VAQKLNSQYGFSYDNLKVLLGGWNSWKQSSATDPAAYPIESSPLGAPATPATLATGDTGSTAGQTPGAAGTPLP
jgi:hypothetical protein